MANDCTLILINDKYEKDPKYARIHKRIMERSGITKRESHIFDALNSVKHEADMQVLKMTQLLKNEGYFSTMMQSLVIDQFVNKNRISLDAETSKYINGLVVKEYINEFSGYVV